MFSYSHHDIRDTVPQVVSRSLESEWQMVRVGVGLDDRCHVFNPNGSRAIRNVTQEEDGNTCRNDPDGIDEDQESLVGMQR